MKIDLTFLGAAGNVTGSQYLLEFGGSRFLVDCGIYQERDLKHRNWEPFAMAAKSVDFILLTHAHLDHCGLIPKLVREGFCGPIYSTAATIDIAKIILLDSAKIQEEDAEYKRRRHLREGRRGPHPERPLYTKSDAEESFDLFEEIEYDLEFMPAPGVRALFVDAGHILGSASIKLTFDSDRESRTVLFSGDIGRFDAPILRDPTVFQYADYVIMESTYGNRSTEKTTDVKAALAALINNSAATNGKLVIPSFAVERSQEVLYRLHELLREKKIPPIRVYMDSPMAINVTEVFRNHAELFDEEAASLIKKGQHLCDFPGLKMCRTADESKAINEVNDFAVIVAGSGMCTGGRVKHHLVKTISRSDCTIVFVGYQAIGTLGRQILDGKNPVLILGKEYPVHAEIKKINGFSGHADRDELFKWIAAIKTPPKRLFLTHGESKASSSFQELIRQKLGYNTIRPAYQNRVTMD